MPYGFMDFVNEQIMRRQPRNAMAQPVTEEEAWANYEREMQAQAAAEQQIMMQQQQAQRFDPNFGQAPQAFDHLKRRQMMQQRMAGYE